MAWKNTIISAINDRIVGTGLSAWRIGLTHDLAERKAFWRDTKKEGVNHWTAWSADSLADAQDIESQFINKGMKGGTGGDLSPNKTVHVYIF